LELLIAEGAGAGGQILAIGPQREVHVVEQAGHGVSRDGDIQLLEQFGDLLRSLVGPL
jgi:hypothetical protein